MTVLTSPIVLMITVTFPMVACGTRASNEITSGLSKALYALATWTWGITGVVSGAPSPA